MPQQETLPRWDMSVFFPGLDSPEFRSAMDGAVAQIGTVEEICERFQVGGPNAGATPEAPVEAFEAVITAYNALMENVRLISAYLSAFVTTDSRDALAQGLSSEFQQHNVRISQIGNRLTAWIGAMDIADLKERSEIARKHAYFLEKESVSAQHQMSPAEEDLASELHLTGGNAWRKLHGDMTSQLIASVSSDGIEPAREIPVSAVRNMAYDADREVRRLAFRAEMEAWERVKVPLAASLNSIKGQVNALSRRRGWATPLDQALFENNIDRETLAAMMEAARESFPEFRRYLKIKARALGLPELAWYDLFAPVGDAASEFDWKQSEEFIVSNFSVYSEKLGEFGARAFRERWIDAQPRPGKVDGAYCMRVRGDESRILSNHKPSFGGVSTLAHELGHAYHNLNLAQRTSLQRRTPMTLAETASIFCETIVRDAALRSAPAEQQIGIIEASLQGACQIVVDISSRWIFEQEVFQARIPRELSAAEFCDAMTRAQLQTYGDGLDSSALHPYMWAVKGHYYSTASFYNYPYMFGMLFGLGLYARYQEDPAEFRHSYDDLLSCTGMADAATLAARFGIDIRTPDFWRRSLGIIVLDIDRFDALVG